MNEIAPALTGLYIAGIGITGLLGVTAYWVDRERRLGARLMLCAPVWLVALPLMFGRDIGRGIGRLWKEATRR